MYTLPHATTSRERITSPIIFIPSHEPLSTTLTIAQLAELLPTLHIYVEPSHPSVAILPAAGISYTGLQSALRWREAEFYQPGAGQVSTLVEMVEIYQALSFLGNKPISRSLWLLHKMIQREIKQGLALEEYQDIWALRHFPFTECFVKAIITRIAKMGAALVDVADKPEFQQMLERDEVLQSRIEASMQILSWVNREEGLRGKVERMRERLEREEHRARRMSAKGEFAMGLATVLE
ncbi:hypothetical protein BU26DRAFT_558498 [Trematosphaeria pertusa]|uniref:Uncharacterized protein n=1 Tax=Trematosphaeria pertusa TaxID=390896 RepID=A0A6A6J4D7_9PLEO|nr:uncharacterized protein BU26DRAFT_558498 [Trematosphaeria pertusa]KAF2257082.1 hypothetical protein BU26DRAFT_558498 [Trematosphaeria pertusa]